jgi:type III pantothenate kinase
MSGTSATVGSGASAAVLLLDSGNSRLKWALARVPHTRAATFAARGVLELSAVRRSSRALAQVLRAGATDAGVIADAAPRIYACNVAGAQVERQIRAAARQAGLPAPLFVRSAAAAGGVRNGYAEVWRLGADRWAALIGAHYEYPGQALCLVGIGSALTIDLLTAQGRHLGGSITPGPQMMIESLLRNTAGIRRRAALPIALLRRSLAGAPAGQPRTDALFARDTRAALLAGARHACAALIERAVADGRARLGRSVRLIIGGGAAESITPLLRPACRRDDDLVLRGLAVLAQHPRIPQVRPDAGPRPRRQRARRLRV